MPQSDVPGERTAPTQPFPTKPAPYELQGTSNDKLLDLTPELKAEAVQIASHYKQGPLFTPPIVRDSQGKIATLTVPRSQGGANWPGGALDAEAGVVYIASVARLSVRGLGQPGPERSDMDYVSVDPAGGRRRRSRDYTSIAEPATENIGPQGLPLIKPPWGRITAIDLNTGEHVWMIPNGEAPDYIREHPALQGVDVSGVGNRVLATLMATKTLLFGGVGNSLFIGGGGGGSPLFRAIDKATGEVVHQIELPASTTGVPMTYMVNGRQFIVVAIGGRGYPAELVALAVP